MGKRFIMYGLAGFCVEVLWTGLGSMMKGDIRLTGWTYIWMFPIYGLAVLFEPVHNRIRHLPAITRGGVYTVLIYAVEFITGLFLKKAIGVCPWNYGNGPMSVYGIITLSYIPVWFVAGLLFEKMHDMLIMIEHSVNGSNY